MIMTDEFNNLICDILDECNFPVLQAIWMAHDYLMDESYCHKRNKEEFIYESKEPICSNESSI